MAYTSITKSSLQFSAITYTGNGSSGRDIAVPFDPGFSWIKKTNTTSNHFLFDQVRGDDKYINSNTTDTEYTESGGFAFGTNKFTLGSWGSVNNNSDSNYIYMAFAEEPLVANVGQSIPATAK